MNLQGRNLSSGMQGEDVKLLQSELRQLGYTISDEEFQAGIFKGTTQEAVQTFQKKHEIDATGVVDERTATLINADFDQLNFYVVKGQIRQANGSVSIGAIVAAYDKDLRSEQLLGQTKIDRNGRYEIKYTAEQFSRQEKKSADLIVRVENEDKKPLVSSSIIFNAQPVEIVDLTVDEEEYQDLSQYERLVLELRPLLGDQAITDLREDLEEKPEEGKYRDITFLSGETGFEKNVLARLVVAHKLAQQAIQPEFWFALLGGSFFQFVENRSLDEQFAAVLDSLSSLDTAAVNKALTRSFNLKEIPEALQGNIANWVEAFLKFIASRAVSESAKPTFIKLVLNDAKIKDAKKQEKFARLFNEYKALTPELLGALVKDQSFTKPEIDDLHTSFQLSELTRGDFSVVKMLKQEFGVRQPETIRTLAKKSESEWVKFVTAKHTAGEIELPFQVDEISQQAKLPAAEVYGKTLERQFREAFPTTAFTGGLERALQTGGTQGLRQAEVLGKFLNSHENFELLNTPVDEFFKNNIHPDFQAQAEDENFRLEVKAVQRVFKLAPTFEATDTLLADDFHSAQKVYRLGESEFVRRYANRPGFTPETARLAWSRAADTHAAVLTVVADLKSLQSEALPLALQNNSAALSSFPNWNNLFKTGDLCECEQCGSVLSPAAYFADLLMFLKDRKAANPAKTVKDILFHRRPDLGFLELNCDNALTPLPYIDVVCEVLEDVVAAGTNDLELSAFPTMPPDPVAAKAAVAAAFVAQNINLGADFSLSQADPSNPNRWVVHGEDVTYLLKKKATPNFFAEILRNTKSGAAELRAYPQYVNPKAYEKLRAAKYPFTLPFDLFAEEVKAGFQKTNLQRWDLMRALRGTSTPSNPTDGEIAAEYFGISSDASATFDEKRLILVADATDAGQQVVWGEKNPTTWLNTISNVKNFLQKTSLEYNELLTLLDLKFINPKGDIGIQHSDTSCDTDKKVIQVLDAKKLDRIHRFLRVWRKLNCWKMWELDLVIRHPRIGNGVLDKQFLINLFYFSQIKTKLGSKTTVEQVCALFGSLNTENHFTILHEKREDALYQNLFLNKRLIQPLDRTFEIDLIKNEIKQVKNPITGLLEQPKLIDHHPVILAALGIREADLILLKELTKASDVNSSYITEDLTLSNLSFLWRHAWLFKLLKFKAEDWKIVLKILPEEIPSFTELSAKQSFLENNYHIKAAGLTPREIDGLLQKIFYREIFDFACPKSAFEFLEKIDYLKTTGFTTDELNWLLASDRSAKAAVKETDATRFLAALRQELETIKTEYDPAQYNFLTATPPTDVDSLTSLLASLLQKLNRSEAEVSYFLETLHGSVLLAASVQGLPPGFTFPVTMTGTLNAIPISFEQVLRFTGVMTAAQKNTLLNDPSLAAITGILAYQQAIEKLFQKGGSVTVTNLPTGFTFPETITSIPNNIPIRYEQTLRFTGVMTAAQKNTLLNDSSLSAVTVIPAYQAAIAEFFNSPRMAVKFFEAVFTAFLAKLPVEVDFKAQLPTALAAKITYDAEQELLRFTGIISNAEQIKLLALSDDADYVTAVNSLATQSQTIAPPDDRIWLTDNDLDITQPTNDSYAKRLANAVKKALNYLLTSSTKNAVVQQTSTQFGLTEAVSRHLLTYYAIVPNPPHPTQKTLLTHLTDDFTIDSTTINSWFWANRITAILKKWKVTLQELRKIISLTTGAQLLDFLSLPLDKTGTIASSDRFLRSSRLLRLRDSFPDTEITLLEVLEKLNGTRAYTKDNFSDDVQSLNEVWLKADIKALTDSLNLTYPADYLLAENWERLHRVFYYLQNLNASADTVKTFAAAAMTNTQAKTLKELLRSKFGAETWLPLSTEIQDVLRERKRDALTAYLLTQPQPSDAPSGKWENTNDLYAYYLLDVEMCSCQLTSRLVQGSGSVQLFVQRCFMGLEQPEVEVKADGDDGDSAWRWWKWMRKYQVWVANRKVFLWPENWIEPELKKDKSQFFKDLENELLQNEINQDTVETAFINYLEKLDGVAQLEIAGFYQEDDGDNAIVHVFGRTPGAEPHLYYYRRYDYRQWTPWEKVDLDIQGDYLIPAVVNKRLFLFWPVFTEVPDEAGNSTVDTPQANQKNVSLPKAWKKLRLQMAVSDYRQGKWTPKRISKDFDESESYQYEIVRKHYQFFPIDRSEIDGRFVIEYSGYSSYSGYSFGSTEERPDRPAKWLSEIGAFEISDCKGVPEQTTISIDRFTHAIRPESPSVGNDTAFLKWVELGYRDKANDFTLENVFALNDPYQSGSTFTQVLGQTPGIFQMTPPWHLSYLDIPKSLVLEITGKREIASIGTWLPFFYNDEKRTFFVLPLLWPSNDYYPEIKKTLHLLKDYFKGQVNINLGKLLWQLFQSPQYRRFHFKNYYHPFVCDFAKLVYNPLKGIPALMSRETQLKNTGFSFRETYQPNKEAVVELPTNPKEIDAYPKEVVDFTPDGAYSSYNWELFFHAPLLIANSLSKNQRFEEARDWYHFIFNPIGVESGTPNGLSMSKYWITKPFFETTDPQYIQQRIDNILKMLAGDTSVPEYSAQAKKDLEAQVEDWHTNPFEPHRIANYRTVAYQKTVVMKYLDNLIAWGDNLFQQDSNSMESINEATQLYILAAEILGLRPKSIPPQTKPSIESFNELEKEFDKFSNALVEVENLVPVMPGNGKQSTDPAPLPTLYFCIPQNDQMLSYWDTVADRLYKIRHCMNIEGVVRQLALFEPPIDPGALVKAIAGGVDISSALADINAPLPLYRFNILLQKANEVCNDVKGLGNALLTGLEKKDAEAMGLLRQSQEIRLLEAVKAVRDQQIEEAKEQLEGLKRSKLVTEERRNYYRDIEKLIDGEQLHLSKLGEAHDFQEAAQGVKLAASIISVLPAIDLGASGFGGSPIAKFKIGGLELGQAADLAAEVLSFLSLKASNDSAMASSQAGFDRRWDDWKLQELLADKELDQLDRQIAAAELRVAIAEKELDNHVLQIENAKETDAFMRSKYTNQELYQWQIGQISGVYFQSYKLAYDLAKRAERCFRFELGLQDSSYINFGYWDSLKKGLLSGEKLQYDLRRLETAYLEQNRREFELTKHISLVLLDPLALVKLRETGRCFFRLPEEIFDLDYPGHYFRRIKSVSLTLPCVVGPYTTISCTLRLLKNSIRINTTSVNGYPHNTEEQGLPADDDRFVENNIPVKAIAASNAQNDSGVFELSFRDERYLPFEGAGAISEWSLELFNDNSPDFGKSLRQFDYSSISDAILHIKYTAREDAGTFKNTAVTHLRNYFSEESATPSLRMFNLRQEFPTQWHRFLNPTNPDNGNIFELEISPSLFPIRDADKTLQVNTIYLLARCKDTGTYNVVMTPLLPPSGANTMSLTKLDQYGGLHFSQKDVGIELALTDSSIKWQLRMTRLGGGNLQGLEVEDVLLVLKYTWK